MQFECRLLVLYTNLHSLLKYNQPTERTTYYAVLLRKLILKSFTRTTIKYQYEYYTILKNNYYIFTRFAILYTQNFGENCDDDDDDNEKYTLILMMIMSLIWLLIIGCLHFSLSSSKGNWFHSGSCSNSDTILGHYTITLYSQVLLFGSRCLLSSSAFLFQVVKFILI